MEKRREDLLSLQSYIGNVDLELTMILQHLQWDRNSLLQKPKMVKCKHNTKHMIPIETVHSHEDQCFLRCNGYSKEDFMLPNSGNSNSGVLIKLGKDDIQDIINRAADLDPSFKRGKNMRSSNKDSKYFIKLNLLQLDSVSLYLCTENNGVEPLTIERLQCTYTADERRAIHDAVVKSAPSCHDLTDLALPSNDVNNEKNSKVKSRVEILAELRDMKRRRTKYRVAAKTRNYSDILRDVIKTQMEIYSDAQRIHPKETFIKNENEIEYNYNHKQSQSKDRTSRHYNHQMQNSPVKNDILKRNKDWDAKDANGTKHKGDTQSEYTNRCSEERARKDMDNYRFKKSCDLDQKSHGIKFYEHESEKRYPSSKRRKHEDKERTNQQKSKKEFGYNHGTNKSSVNESDRYDYKYRYHSDKINNRTEEHMKPSEVYKRHDKYSSNESSNRELKSAHSKNYKEYDVKYKKHHYRK